MHSELCDLYDALPTKILSKTKNLRKQLIYRVCANRSNNDKEEFKLSVLPPKFCLSFQQTHIHFSAGV